MHLLQVIEKTISQVRNLTNLASKEFSYIKFACFRNEVPFRSLHDPGHRWLHVRCHRGSMPIILEADGMVR